jgi:hypothetical protein
MGIFARKKLSEENFGMLAKLLLGELVGILKAIYQLLTEGGYPSLFKGSFLIGPLALMNHSNDALFAFRQSRKTVLLKPLYETFVVEKGQEILVYYGSDRTF